MEIEFAGAKGARSARTPAGQLTASRASKVLLPARTRCYRVAAGLAVRALDLARGWGGELVGGEMTDGKYDVVAVNLETNDVRLMAEGKTYDNAEAVVKMAVMRRGVDEEFFAEVPAGKYKTGDKWSGRE